MSRTLLIAAALALLPAVARPEQARAEGNIDAGDARVELLGRTYAAGDTIELPEGYLRVEEDGPADGEIGSFAIVPAATIARANAVPERATHPMGTGSGERAEPAAREEGVAPAPGRAEPDCSADRAAYLAEIWKQSGIELSDPQGFIAGLAQTEEGADLTLAWFALSTDAFRTLAWSSDARAKATALARCAQGR